MTARTRALLLALAGVGLVLAGPGPPGTGAASAVQADRGVDVRVVPDSEAYLGVDGGTLRVGGDWVSDAAAVEITNRLGEPVTVEASVADTTLSTAPQVEGPGDLAAGDAGWISADVDCGDHVGSASITVAVHAAGESADVRLRREVAVDCGDGDANPLVEATATDASVTGDGGDATLLTLENRAPDAIAVTVAASEAAPDAGPSVTSVSAPTTLAAGETGEVVAAVDCAGVPDGTDETVRFDVAADNGTAGVRLDRAATVTCAG